MSSTDYSQMSVVRLSVISEIGVLLYAVVTHILPVAYFALVFEETRALHCSTHQQVHVQDDIISFVDILANAVPAVLDGIQ